MSATVIQQRYPVGRAVGEGSLWHVFESVDLASGGRVALKIMRAPVAADPEQANRILKQIAETVSLAHPNIARVLVVGVDDEVPFLVQEFVDGRSLRHWFMEEGRSYEDLRDKLGLILTALTAAHERGVLHRCLKPENILVTPEGDVKVTDFGQASRLETYTHQTAFPPQGVAYFAPEQARGKRGDARSDLYALGVVLYELITGRLPFWESDPIKTVYRQLHETPIRPRQINSRVPPWLEALVMKLLAKEPESRFASSAKVFEELSKLPPEIRPAHNGDEPFVGARKAIQAASLVGREVQLAELQAAWEQATSGRGSYLALAGEPGIGRTRLASTLGQIVASDGGWWLRIEGSESAGVPFLSMGATTLRTYLRRGRPFREVVEPDDALTLESLLTDAPSQLSSSTGPPFIARQIEALTRLYVNLSAQTPVLLQIDDVGLLDEASLTLLARLAHELPVLRLLLVVTCDPAVLPTAAKGKKAARSEAVPWLAGARVLMLDGLDQTCVDQLACELAGASSVAPDLSALLLEKTRGNPLWIEELMQTALRDHFGESNPDGVLGVRSATGPAGLAQVNDAPAARTLGLPEKVTSVLGVAACIGRRFEFEILQRVSGGDPDELISVLKWAANAGLVQSTGAPGRERYRFSHEVMQHRLYALVEARHRKRLHLLIAAAVEELFEPRLAAWYPVLMAHYREAQQWKKGLHFALAAGEYFEALQLLSTAAVSFEAALWFAAKAHEGDEFELVTVRRLARLYQALGRSASSRRLRSHAAVLARRLKVSDVDLEEPRPG
ncbi:MAG: serine/threonine protein kinase [Candidatus Xenobia bacterium]